MYYYVDHTSRFQHNTGIQRCVRSIAAALIAHRVPLRPLVWNSETADFVPADDDARQHLSRWNGPSPDSWASDPAELHWSDQWLLIVELVSGPHVPSAVALHTAAERWNLHVAWIFHDAIPLRLATLYGRRGPEVSRRHAAYMRGLALFDRVLANSQTTAQHLCSFLRARKVDRQRIEHLVAALPLATELPCGSRPSLEDGAAAANRWLRECGRRPMRLLCVGSLEPRKNHVALLKAMAALRQRGRLRVELVVVGWANDAAVVRQLQRAVDLGLPLRWESRVDDQRLQLLYQWCDATVYPSLEEGFGLPVAESLWQRRPCLCSGDGALGELAADGGCLTATTSDWRSLMIGLESMTHDVALYQSLVRQIADRPMRSWRQYVRELLDDLLQHSSSESLVRCGVWTRRPL